MYCLLLLCNLHTDDVLVIFCITIFCYDLPLLLLPLQPFYDPLYGTTRSELVPEETFTHSPILIIIQPLSASSICYDLQHPPCSMYVLDDLFTQPLPLDLKHSSHTPYISSCNECLLFATHAHTIAACFAISV